MDFSKAFDLLNHEILVAKLHHVGFKKSASDMILSFLSNRMQQVKLNNKVSSELMVSQGVPQGSILGPLLYSIYTCSFDASLEYCDYHVYADDTQIYMSFDRSDTLNATEKINADLKNVTKFSEDHLLQINANKTCAIVVGSNKHRQNVINDLKLSIGNSPINYTDSCKNLGLILDKDLRFKAHVASVLKKAYFSLKMIYAQRHYLSKDIKKNLCELLVLSHFNFCDGIYGPCLDNLDKRRIQKAQNSCLRLIFGIRRPNPISHKLKVIKWLNMHNRRKLHMAVLYFKIVKTKVPTYLHNKLTFRTDVHNLLLRHRNTLTIPRHTKSIFRRSFSYNIATCAELVNCDLNFSVTHFKRNCRRMLFHSQCDS